MKPEYVINRQGRDMVLYPGLLDAAHQQGLKRISTRVLQFPGPENGYSAVCAAEIETDRGIFSGIGDASPENVSRNIAPHIIRMSETRAKARAFRDALNVGELLADDPSGDTDEAPPTPIRQPGTVANGAASVNAHTGEITPPTFRPAPAPRGPGVADKARRRIDAEVRPASATATVPQTRLERMEARYAALLAEARELEIDAVPLPEGADESTLTDLGISLKDQIDDARRAKQTA